MSSEKRDPVRLSGWDFATWRAASEDPIMRSTMVGLLIMDGEPDWDRLVDRYERASRVVPILRQKVVEGPVPWANPRLLIDPDFDLTFHLRRFRMSTGATWGDVLDECRRQSMTDFDRDRPLWKVTLLEGLPGGRSAIITKLHHAVADGQGAIQLGAALVDLTPEGFDLGPMPRAPRGEHLSSFDFAELMFRDNVDWAMDAARAIAGSAVPAASAFLSDPVQTVSRLREVADSLVRFTKTPSAQLSPIMTGRSINYHYGAFQLPFAQLRNSAKAVGHTVNDAYLAAVAAGLGEYHRRQGAPVDQLNLNMPISLRKSDDFGQNAVTVAHFQVPTTDDDPVALMNEISQTVRAWRAEPALGFADKLGEISRFIPFDVIAAAATASDVTASNVPGPPVQVFLAGAPITQFIPLPPPIGAAVFVAMLTYNGQATIGVAMDDRAVSDKALLMDCIRHGFATVTGADVPQWNPLAVPGTPGRAEDSKAQKPAAKSASTTKAASTAHAPTKKAPIKQASVKKVTARKAVEKAEPATKAAATTVPAKATSAKKAAGKSAPAKKATAKAAPAKKATAKAAPAKKAAAKATPAKKAAAAKKVSAKQAQTPE